MRNVVLPIIGINLSICREDPLVKYEFEEIKSAIEFDRTGGSFFPLCCDSFMNFNRQLRRTLGGNLSSALPETENACGLSSLLPSSLSGTCSHDIGCGSM